MAPVRTSTRRATRRSQAQPQPTTGPSSSNANALENRSQVVTSNGAVVANEDLFLDPMMGLPLQIYVEKDVNDRDNILHMISVSAAV